MPNAILAASTPEPTLAQPTPTIQPVASQTQEFISPTPTPLSEEYFSTPDQTTGIILGASVMLLVILFGTLGAMRAARKNVTPPTPPQKP